MNYYERHLGDYIRDTAHLSLLEHGVYTRLLDVYYGREAPIPEGQAARLVGARTPEERAAVDSVLAEYFVLADGMWRNKRCDEELARHQEFLAGQRRKGQASAAARRGRSPAAETQPDPDRQSTGVEPVLNRGSTAVEPVLPSGTNRTATEGQPPTTHLPPPTVLPPSPPDSRVSASPARAGTSRALSDAGWLAHWSLIRAGYPAGAGRQDWIGAERLARRLVDEGGATAEDLMAGVRRYAAHVAATGRLVLNPARFFGDADLPWAQPWPIPEARGAGAPALEPAALAAWDRLIASDGAERDARVEAGLQACGGWLAVKGRTDRNSRQLRDDFCRAWSSRQGAAA